PPGRSIHAVSALVELIGLSLIACWRIPTSRKQDCMMPNTVRWQWLPGLLAAAAALAGCGQAASQSATSAVSSGASARPESQPAAVSTSSRTVHLAWTSNAMGLMLWPLANDAGYFAKYGLNVSLSFVNGSAAAVASLLAGELDAADMAGSSMPGAVTNGADLVMPVGFNSQGYFRLMAVPQIHSLQDLKGKTVAITRQGDSSDQNWQGVRQYLGWQPQDVKVVAGGSQAGQIALMQKGEAQAGPFTVPNNILAQEAGAHEIFDGSQLKMADQGPGMVLTRRYLSANRPVVLSLAKASIEAMARWKKDPEFTKAVLRKYLKTDDSAFIDEGYKAYTLAWPEVPYPSA